MKISSIQNNYNASKQTSFNGLYFKNTKLKKQIEKLPEFKIFLENIEIKRAIEEYNVIILGKASNIKRNLINF